MLGLFLYSCWRRHKGLKEGVYHVSAHHGEWEDIRENVLNYDEEGGGEQDQVNTSLAFAGFVLNVTLSFQTFKKKGYANEGIINTANNV